jgi:hypothetical protein
MRLYTHMKRVDRECLCKRRFDSEQECLDSIAKSGSRIPLFAYKCSFGDHWHKTKHQPPTNAKKESL